MNHEEYKLQSIIPPNGWCAVFAYQNNGQFAHAHPLVAWALTTITEHNGDGEIDLEYQDIIGYVPSDFGGSEPALTGSNFLGYLAAGDSLADWEDRARAYCGEEPREETIEGALIGLLSLARSI